MKAAHQKLMRDCSARRAKDASVAEKCGEVDERSIDNREILTQVSHHVMCFV